MYSHKKYSLPPNPLGLYDMSGSVSEWVYDYFYPYPDSAVVNPVCNDSIYSGKKVARGFRSGGIYGRGLRKLSNTGSGVGLRCAANVKERL